MTRSTINRTRLDMLTRRATAARHELAERVARWSRQPERGDVPGWVLVTVMTAGLVVLLWAVAGPLLSGLFSDAVEGVTGP